LTLRRVFYACAALFAVYFPTALWLDRSYINVSPKGAAVQLLPPFTMNRHAAIPHKFQVDRFGHLADDENDARDTRSPIVIYENLTPLGPGHSNFADIRDLGAGRFAHWARHGVVFSTSDNSDPNTNGRTYWVVVPKGLDQPFPVTSQRAAPAE
jgi:hypothetical protein